MSEVTAANTSDEIDLIELLGILKDTWLSWVGSAIAGGVLAVLASQLITPQYEAASLIRIAQVGQAQLIESPALVMERVKSLGFQQQVCLQLRCTQEGFEGLKKQLTVTQPKNTDVLSLVVRAASVAKAKQLSNTVLAALAAEHEALAAPIKASLSTQLALDESHLAAIEAQQSQYWAQFARERNNVNGSFAVLQLALMAGTQEREGLRTRIADQRRSLAPPNTRPTERIQALYIADKPVSPKVTLMAVLGVLAGVLLGILGVFVRRMIKA